MNQLSAWLTSVVDLAPAWAVYLVVAAVLYSETAVLICGLIMPSEAILVAAGVAAAIGRPNIVVLCLVAIGAALLGDLTGYALGQRTGPRIMDSWAGRKFGAEHWDQARRRVRTNVYVTVPIGRWIGYVRSVVPVTAGIAHVRARRYALATFIGGASWATTVLLLSYALGAAAGVQLIAVLVIVLVSAGTLAVLVRWLVHRVRLRRAAEAVAADDPAEGGAAADPFPG